ncbi:hypothetical protein QJS04_geneDACA001145 [Acorus gramineus]|uniref:Uncharacterized protein n=1 Tax=Acorus gramineus TaxID=55184 RepID=A0AAV9ABU0_ACOGR|nr:hypothetical protein QJS04_geneDACA001145 [Acorus gramineus]
MAATVSAWAKPGAWALDSEQQETLDDNPISSPHQHQPQQDFPSLSASAAVKPSKKKKSQPLSLSEFTTGRKVTHGAAKYQPAGAARDEPLVLPTGPRERTAEELERSSTRLGGGFSGYGGRRSGEQNPRWGRDSSDEQPQRRKSESGVDDGPSRADEVDDWGAAKRSVSVLPPPPSERRERSSRADGSESWISNKPSPPAAANEGRRRGGFEMFNRGGDSDTWTRGREETGNGRPRLVLQPPSRLVSDNGSVEKDLKLEEEGRRKGANPFGEARPREEVLAEKGQDWKKMEEKLESMKIRDSDGKGVITEGRKGFGLGNGRAEDRMERSWRKAEPVDVPQMRYA